jgi:hypothetical protein
LEKGFDNWKGQEVMENQVKAPLVVELPKSEET